MSPIFIDFQYIAGQRDTKKGNAFFAAEWEKVSEFSSETSEVDALELSVAGAMARQYASDGRAFLGEFARLLESAIPGEAVIHRTGLFGGDKRPVRRVEITFAHEAGAKAVRYALEDTGRGPLQATRTQIVREVALKTEPLDVSDWIQAVGAAIARRATESKATRDALQNLL